MVDEDLKYIEEIDVPISAITTVDANVLARKSFLVGYLTVLTKPRTSYWY
jgi:hypothetical protein